jgi:hypothetical protein
VTRADIEQDLAEYRQRLKQAIADANAIGGVVQFLEQKLAETPAESHIVIPEQPFPAERG